MIPRGSEEGFTGWETGDVQALDPGASEGEWLLEGLEDGPVHTAVH